MYMACICWWGVPRPNPEHKTRTTCQTGATVDIMQASSCKLPSKLPIKPTPPTRVNAHPPSLKVKDQPPLVPADATPGTTAPTFIKKASRRSTTSPLGGPQSACRHPHTMTAVCALHIHVPEPPSHNSVCQVQPARQRVPHCTVPWSPTKHIQQDSYMTHHTGKHQSQVSGQTATAVSRQALTAREIVPGTHSEEQNTTAAGCADARLAAATHDNRAAQPRTHLVHPSPHCTYQGSGILERTCSAAHEQQAVAPHLYITRIPTCCRTKLPRDTQEHQPCGPCRAQQQQPSKHK